jgi:hypothetical protein
MSDQQLIAVALGAIPTMLVVMMGILINNARLSDLRAHVDARFNEVDRRFSEMDHKMDLRFADVKETWRAELHRVEEVLDARLKHLEER